MPEWADERRAALTVEHLLQSAAGLAGDPTAGPGEAAWTVAAAASCVPTLRPATSRLSKAGGSVPALKG